MKKLGLFIVAFSWSLSLLAAIPEEVVSSFNAGNSLYQEGQYEQAIKKYDQCLKQGYVSGPLYYNMGNCYFKLGRLGKTILSYRRAQQLTPSDPELQANLNYVTTLLEDKISASRNSLLNMFSLGKWTGFAVFIWLLLMGLWLAAIFVPRVRKIARRVMIVLTLLFIISLASAIVIYNRHSAPAAIILVKEVPVYYGPSEGDVEAFLLHEGTEVKIRKQQAGWYQIQLPDGKSGWLSGRAAEKI